MSNQDFVSRLIQQVGPKKMSILASLPESELRAVCAQLSADAEIVEALVAVAKYAKAARQAEWARSNIAEVKQRLIDGGLYEQLQARAAK